MAEDEKLTRREFLRKGAAGAAAAGFASWGRMASARALGANDRINMAVIGCGGQGTGHLRRMVDMSRNPAEKIQVIAVCDVYEPRKKRAQDISGAKVFHDYSELLQMPDLDAVLIATPDHWHSTITIDAMEAGKDVYCEKPMTLYWHEAKEVAETADRLGRVVQIGAQSSSEDRWWQANKLIREGAIGKVLWGQTGYSRNSRDGEWNWYIEPNASPENLDWDRWLGPAQKRPFDKERYFRFRKYWDYSGGIATDLLYHSLAHMEVALGPEFPVKVSSTGGIYVFHDREVPDTFHVMIEYPSGHSMVLVSSMCNDDSLDDRICGHKASLTFEGGDVVLTPQGAYGNEVASARVHSQPRKDHLRNFLECIRTREQPHLNAQAGYRVMVAIALSVMSYREGRAIHFDPDKQEIIA